jgi:dihydrodiol dehydrogenase / D-xylose 1-dehydrogenase (NADP)
MLTFACVSSEIIVGGIACRPNKYTIRRKVEKAKDSDKGYEEEVVDMDFPGFGLYWEADAVARALRGTHQASCAIVIN